MTFIRRWSVPLLACAVDFCALRGSAFAEEIKIPQPHEATLSADEIIARMVKVYETCQSYQDDGVVDISTNGVVESRPFSTAFVRPNLFRYEFTSSNYPRFVLWWDSKNIQSWSNLMPNIITHQDFSHALSRPTGISGGSASRIPSLLVPGTIWGSGLKLVKGAILHREESTNGVHCYKIEYSRPGSDKVNTLWIDKRRCVLIKMQEVQVIGDKRTHHVTTYTPKIDISIDPSLFDFTPPQPGREEPEVQ